MADRRVSGIDTLRGLAITMMIAYHLIFDIWYLRIGEFDITSLPLSIFQHSIGTLFLLLVGISLTLSERHNREGYAHYVKRAAFLGLVALSITLATWVYPHEGMITFGIIHCIALSVLLAPLFFRLGKLNVLLGLLLIAAGLIVPAIQTDSPYLFWFGVTRPDYTALDFYPIIPWLGVVLIGVFAGQTIYPKGRGVNARKESRLSRTVAFAGRHSLAIYLIHQPVMMGILLAYKAFFLGC
ncbi:MAG: heparan-alpha-glucosaminide N-acetyltransferase [Candidatus Micrarchaeota archaeon]